MKNEITICMGSSCFARGNKENVHVIKQFIKQHHLDAQVLLKGTLCTDNCAIGPIIYINNQRYTNLSKNELIDILKSKLCG